MFKVIEKLSWGSLILCVGLLQSFLSSTLLLHVYKRRFMIILLLLFSLRNTPTTLEQEEEEEEGVRRRGHDLQGFLTNRHSHGHPANLSTSVIVSLRHQRIKLLLFLFDDCNRRLSLNLCCQFFWHSALVFYTCI